MSISNDLRSIDIHGQLRWHLPENEFRGNNSIAVTICNQQQKNLVCANTKSGMYIIDTDTSNILQRQLSYGGSSTSFALQVSSNRIFFACGNCLCSSFPNSQRVEKTACLPSGQTYQTSPCLSIEGVNNFTLIAMSEGVTQESNYLNSFIPSTDGLLRELWKFGPIFSISTPSISQEWNLVFILQSQTLYALHINNGSEAWKSNKILTPIVPYVSVGNNFVYVVTRDGLLFSFHISNGSLAWRISLEGLDKFTPPTIDGNGNIFCASLGEQNTIYVNNVDIHGNFVWTIQSSYNYNVEYISPISITSDGSLQFALHFHDMITIVSLQQVKIEEISPNAFYVDDVRNTIIRIKGSGFLPSSNVTCNIRLPNNELHVITSTEYNETTVICPLSSIISLSPGKMNITVAVTLNKQVYISNVLSIQIYCKFYFYKNTK